MRPSTAMQHPSSAISEINIRSSLPVFRLAVPDASAAPFDTILQIISPISYGWAGLPGVAA